MTAMKSLFISVFIIDHREQPSALDGNIRNGNKQRVEIIITSRVPDKFPLINVKKRTEAPTYRRAAEYTRTYIRTYIHAYTCAYIHFVHTWRAQRHTHTHTHTYT